MLVVVVGVGWRCTPHGHEPCHLLFNLGEHSSRTPSRTHRSHHPHRDRNGWYGGRFRLTDCHYVCQSFHRPLYAQFSSTCTYLFICYTLLASKRQYTEGCVYLINGIPVIISVTAGAKQVMVEMGYT